MLGLDRGAARAAWTVLAIAIFVAAIYIVRETILIFTVAVFFAYMLAPVVRWVERYTHRRYSREIALAIVYAALVAGMIGAVIAIGSRVAEEAATLANYAAGLVVGMVGTATVEPAQLVEALNG